MPLGKREEEQVRAMVLLDSGQACVSDRPARPGLSSRQLRRVRSRWQSSDASGLVDDWRDNGGNRSRPGDRDHFVSRCRGLSARDRYPPAHAAGYFGEECGVLISLKTSRR